MRDILTASDGFGRLIMRHPIRHEAPINKSMTVNFVTFDRFFISIHLPERKINLNAIIPEFTEYYMANLLLAHVISLKLECDGG